MPKKKIDAEYIYGVLSKQTFFDFYDGDNSPFAEHIQDSKDTGGAGPSKEEIIAKINRIFGLE